MYLETPETPMHVGSLHLYDLPEDYEGDFYEDVKKHVAGRMHARRLLVVRGPGAAAQVTQRGGRDPEQEQVQDGDEAELEGDRDGRLRIVNQAHHGLVYSLNRGIELARGTYIARMDADDISAPERFATEVKLFASHPKAAVVGTSIMRIDEAGRQLGAEYYLAKNTELCQDLAIRCPFAHGSVMMRKDLVRQVGGYRQEFWPAEDYDLWRRMAAIGEFANSLEPLYLYRGNVQGISATQDSRQLDLAMRISGELLDGYPRDIPLRRCLAFYERAPEEARAAAIERIIEDYFRISVAYARRGKILLAVYRYVKLALSGRVGLEFATKTLANKLGIRTAPIGGSLRA